MNMDPNDKENKLKETEYIIEKASDESIHALSQDSIVYDLVVSEASFAKYSDISFTVSGLSRTKKEGQQVWTAYLDIEKSRFVDFFEGTQFELKEGLNMVVAKIEKKDHDDKGKVYFNVVKE
jgi:hypothetical protein